MSDLLEGSLKGYMDLEFEIGVIVATTTLTVRELLALRVGRTIRLNRPASENLLLQVEDRPMAIAEVLSLKKGPGARVVELLTSEENH